MLDYIKGLGLAGLLNSRRFWVSLLGLLGVVGLELSPEQVNAVLIIVGLLVGGYSAEDYANAKK